MRNSDPWANSSSAADAELFDLALIGHAALFALRAPRRHPVLASIALFLVMFTAVIGILFFPKRYEITTTILAGSPLTGALVGERERDAPTRAARAILLRRENLQALSEEVNLAERYLAQRPFAIRAVHGLQDFIKGTERDVDLVRESLVETLEERLWVHVDTEDTVFIGFQWWDAQIAFDVVNAAAQSFLEMRHAAEIKTVAESIAILEEHRTRLERQIDERLSAIEERDKKESKDKPAPARITTRPVSRIDPELARLQTMLAATQRTAADLESARQQRIVQLQAELLQQQSVFAVDHPSLVATRRMLETLQRPSAQLNELRAEARELETAILSRGGGAAAGPVNRTLPEPTPLLLDIDPREEYERAQLRHVRSQLEEIDNRITSSRLQMETAAAAFKHRYSIVSPPRMPKGPIKPYTAMFLVSGVLGGVMFALVLSVAADLRSGLVIERWQLEQQLGLPVLGEMRK